MTNPEKLAAWCRLEHGRTARLATAIGVSRPTIYQYRTEFALPTVTIAALIEVETDGEVPADEWGDLEHRTPVIAQLVKLAETLDCDPDSGHVEAALSALDGARHGKHTLHADPEGWQIL